MQKSRPNTSSAGRSSAPNGLKAICSQSKTRGINLLVLKSQESCEVPTYIDDQQRDSSNKKQQTQTISRSSKLKPLSLKDDEPPTLYEALTPKQLDADFILQPWQGRESENQRKSQLRSSGTRGEVVSSGVASQGGIALSLSGEYNVQPTMHKRQQANQKANRKVIPATAFRASSMLPSHESKTNVPSVQKLTGHVKRQLTNGPQH